MRIFTVISGSMTVVVEWFVTTTGQDQHVRMKGVRHRCITIQRNPKSVALLMVVATHCVAEGVWCSGIAWLRDTVPPLHLLRSFQFVTGASLLAFLHDCRYIFSTFPPS